MPKRRFIWDIQKVILDVKNNNKNNYYFRYQKSKCQFLDIQNNDTSISDIKNSYYEYPK